MDKSKRDSAAHKTAGKVRGTESSAVEGLQVYPDASLFPTCICLSTTSVCSKQMATNICLIGKL